MKVGFINKAPAHLSQPRKTVYMNLNTLQGFEQSINKLSNVEIVPEDEADVLFGIFCQMCPGYSNIHEKDFGDAKKIFLMLDCRRTYGGKHLSKILESVDAIWCGGSYLEGFKRFKTPAWFFPCGTYDVGAENWKKVFDIGVTMGRETDVHRTTATRNYIAAHPERAFRFFGNNSKKTLWNIESQNVTYKREVGIDIFKDCFFNLEAESDMQRKLPKETIHWSNRQAIATSALSHVITDYKPTLDEWDSAIAYSEKPEYNLKDIEKDLKKWNWANIIKPLLKETLSQI